MQSSLVAVWEARSGFDHPEVFARQGSFLSWLPPEVISEDDVASRSPVVSARPEGAAALAAWEDSAATGWTVFARYFSSGTWQDVEMVSTTLGDARDPAIREEGTLVAWADFREGAPQIYLRARGASSWDPEERLTDLPQGCRRPNLTLVWWETSPGTPLAAVEATGDLGAVEPWWWERYPPYPVCQLSPDDGIPSVRPNLGSAYLEAESCIALPGAGRKAYADWTDEPVEGTLVSHFGKLEGCGFVEETSSLTYQGASHSLLALHDGTSRADVLQTWVETIGGVSTLRARLGSLPNCYREATVALTPLLLGPGGIPTTHLRFVDLCSGEGLHNWIDIAFGPELDAALTWAPGQDHPEIYAETDENGDAFIPIRGGGCAFGSADAGVGPYCDEVSWPGAKSPDVNGDCLVDPTDLAYVQQQLGTSDFCADLDGSGTVGPEDVAIVELTMGDRCDGPSAVEDAVVSGVLVLEARPNPCRTKTRIRLAGSRGGSLGEPPVLPELRIVDAAGRLVRRLVSVVAGSGRKEVVWDLRDDAGEELPSGCYFAQAATRDGILKTPILIIR